jgi:DNA repair protein RadC
VADELLALFDSRGIPGIEDLTKIRGSGMGKGALICAAFEFSRRRLCADRKRITCPSDILPLVSHYADRKQEYFLCASLTGAHEVQEIRVVTMGILNRALVHPREVFSDPIRDRAGAVLALHNHPSGNVEPSPEDREITIRLKNAGETLGIPLLDHIIFSARGYYSFMEKGEL